MIAIEYERIDRELRQALNKHIMEHGVQGNGVRTFKFNHANAPVYNGTPISMELTEDNKNLKVETYANGKTFTTYWSYLSVQVKINLAKLLQI
jgi:hypothetical protein